MPKDPPQLRPQEPSRPSSPKLIFDWEDWLPYLLDTDIDEGASDEDKRAMIEAVWSIVMGFMDLEWEVQGRAGFDQKTCGQVLDLKAVLEAAVLNLRDISPDKAQTPTDQCLMPPPCEEEDAA